MENPPYHVLPGRLIEKTFRDIKKARYFFKFAILNVLSASFMEFFFLLQKVQQRLKRRQ